MSLDGPEFDAVLNRNAGFAQRPQRQSFNRHIIFQPLRGEKIGYRLDANRQPRHSIFIQHHVGKKSRRVPPCRVCLAANEPGLLQPRLQANIDWQSEMVDPVDEPRAGLVAQSIGESDKVSAAIYKSGKRLMHQPGRHRLGLPLKCLRILVGLYCHAIISAESPVGIIDIIVTVAMHKILLLGAGKIGEMIATLLTATGDYELRVGDIDSLALERLRRSVDVPTMLLDADDSAGLSAAIEGCQSVISALSFRSNQSVAQAALADRGKLLRPDRGHRDGSGNSGICGDGPAGADLHAPVRPGAGLHLDAGQRSHAEVRHVRRGPHARRRAAAVPVQRAELQSHLVHRRADQRILQSLPGDPRRPHDRCPAAGRPGTFSLDGVHYEAFNTSGGLGTLCESLSGQVRELNYRTVRYRGHRDLMAFLLQDLRMAERREMLKEILERALPITLQDVVVIFCNVTGSQEGRFTQWSDARKIYSQTIGGRTWSAIQVTTAAGICAVLDLHVAGCLPRSGFVKQEQIDLAQFVHNRFGRYYDGQITTRYSAAIRGPVCRDGSARGTIA